MTRRPCTCQAPPGVVDVTNIFDAMDQDPEAPSNAAADIRNEETRSLLLDNLTRYGWSYVRITISKDSTITNDTTTTRRLLGQTPDEWKRRLVSYFCDDFLQGNQHSIPGITYRAAESGKPGTVEPKQSLEVTRWPPDTGAIDTDTAVVEDLQALTQVLHRVACAVRNALHLPRDVLLDEPPNPPKNPTRAAPFDLLRVFYYDVVKENVNDNNSPARLGSSEHTDWGSFTVVWQDDTAEVESCLQTYCLHHEQWVNVEAPPPPAVAEADPNTRTWDFVVHVGDLTSLAMGVALQKMQQEMQQTKELASTSDDSDETTTVLWPSPRHRVVSPTTQKRLSLVYFCYPPAATSLEQMQQEMTTWWASQGNPSTCATVQIPFDDYYLLKNQSSEGTEDASRNNPRAVYDSLKSLNVSQVLQEKWKQVQR